jgi:hypothetical protein
MGEDGVDDRRLAHIRVSGEHGQRAKHHLDMTVHALDAGRHALHWRRVGKVFHVVETLDRERPRAVDDSNDCIRPVGKQHLVQILAALGIGDEPAALGTEDRCQIVRER